MWILTSRIFQRLLVSLQCARDCTAFYWIWCCSYLLIKIYNQLSWICRAWGPLWIIMFSRAVHDVGLLVTVNFLNQQGIVWHREFVGAREEYDNHSIVVQERILPRRICTINAQLMVFEMSSENEASPQHLRFLNYPNSGWFFDCKIYIDKLTRCTVIDY